MSSTPRRSTVRTVFNRFVLRSLLLIALASLLGLFFNNTQNAAVKTAREVPNRWTSAREASGYSAPAPITQSCGASFNSTTADFGTGGFSVTVGDFNGDAKPDLAVGNSLSNSVSILLANGDGTFQPRVNYGVGTNPDSVAVAYFNGDAKIDLVVANGDSGSVSILLGNGDGTFEAALTFSVAPGPWSVVVGDFNGDTKADLAVTNENYPPPPHGEVSILLGNGDGTLQSPVNYDVGSGPRSVAVGDFNGDTKPDLVVGNYTDHNVSILLGNGDGTFQAAVNLGAVTTPYSTHAIVVGDFNEDTKADLAVANYDSASVSILLGNGDSTFQSAVNFGVGTRPRSVAVGDFNGDTEPDLAVGNYSDGNISILAGNGDGTFQSAVNFAANTIIVPLEVVAADFNGDTKPDLAMADNGTYPGLILLNTTICHTPLVVGRVVAWAYNYEGQIDIPSNLGEVTAIAAGAAHSLALKSDGTVVGWGRNLSGQATPPTGLSNVTAIASGDWTFHSLALKSDGTVVAWGYNGYGQTTVPAGLSGVTAISAGNSHSLALEFNGTVVAWGYNNYGISTPPIGLSKVKAIAAGSYHNLALKSDSTVVAWGYNGSGQLNIPSGLSNVTAIAAGHAHSLALKSDGRVVAWGDNTYGQLDIPSGLNNVTAISAGGQHNLALKSDGTVVAWGDNTYSQLNIPPSLRNVLAISAGNQHSLALISSNSPPIAKCKSIQVSANNGCQASITAAEVDDGSFDPDTGDSIASRTLDNSGPFGLGSHSVSLTVTDIHGSASACSTTVTVVDNSNPVISCPANITMTANLGSNSAPVIYSAPTATDDCGVPIVNCSKASGSSFPVGTTTVSCSAADSSNNAGACAFTVTVLTPQGAVQQLIDKVNSLVSQGVLNQGNGNALTVKLQAVISSINRGNNTAACNQLQAFINQTQAFINTGKLTTAQGQLLINSANAVMSILGC